MAAVIVHGGAYAIPDAVAAVAETGCKEAAEKAYTALLSGKSALDAGNTCKNGFTGRLARVKGHQLQN